ncbi:MAG: BamA/TamA family outer membrane protein [Bacteroidetes bacterium]|nr:BamA/TamA family outer membrane protein [Bacteroidota bacterium]
MRIFKNTLLVILFFYAFGIYSARAQNDTSQVKKEKKKISFRHPDDNAFDMSSFLLEHKGLLPIPILITEPAVGYGGGAALIYFHNRKKQYNSYVPPDITGGVGLITENGTWAAGAFHAHTFGENRVRTLTALIKPSVKINYYGNNSELLSKNPITINLNSWLVFQQAQVRLAKSNFYLGASYSYFQSDITLDTLPGRPLINLLIKQLNVNSVISTIKPMVVYDNRDNVFTPTKGINAEVSCNYSAQWLGSSDDYGVINTKFLGYVPVVSRLFSSYRFQGSYLLGDAPFYAYPFVSLRGIPAMRYQSNNTLVAETEWRYNIYKRYSILAFTGLGKAFQSTSNFNDIDWAYNVGTGFRYEIAKTLGTHMGVDFAWGNAKDFAFYIVFGTSWF